jgi:hypothetical protein
MTRHATPKSIKAAKEWFQQNPGCKLQVSWSEHWTEGDFKRWLKGCVHARASRGLTATGRKYSDDYQTQMRRFSREINSNVVIRYIPALDGLRERFAHRVFCD